MSGRLSLHGAYPNRSPDCRATLTFGFHRRKTLLGKQMSASPLLGEAKEPSPSSSSSSSSSMEKRENMSTYVYTEELLGKRSRMIQLAIDARKRKFPNETSYVYQPFLGREDECRWDEQRRDEIVEEALLADYLVI